ncbi:hypothetical protein EDEG_01415 [Edhazardia aedis USNM 41457]|uniref:SKP1 component POZ domain-containing protein n=1 Tax=Edhazardia aedis (strain USNM 41457) TaxID=1003232 RepID=J8ZXA4_EDHAE|nr:hypothetical protein EDEG_01415 [Edhazardia aedis USNM 41457]|eukprot:EJW04318.1 hypothetical protein EDEG_01415 [Edhazardia aedis USNM 41457]
MDSYKEIKREARKSMIQEGEYELISEEGTSFFITHEEVKESELLMAFFHKEAPFIESATRSVRLPISDDVMKKVITWFRHLSAKDGNFKDSLLVDLGEDEIFRILEVSSYLGI